MNWKRSGRIGIVVLMAVAAFAAYRDSRPPPLPSYLKVPPGSTVEISRNLNLVSFFEAMGSPQYYARIHSPLAAWPTARYLQNLSRYSKRTPQAERFRPGHSDMHGCGIERTGYFIPIDNSRDMYTEIGKATNTGNEIDSIMRVWPEPTGSTIEFYYETRMN